MNIPKAYTKGFTQTAKYPRMLFILYAANLLVALFLALPFLSVLSNGIGHSDLYTSMLQNFDYTAYSEFINHAGKNISGVMASLKWTILAYFLLSVFLTGGIIKTFNEDNFSTATFFGGSAYSFFRYLGLGILMIFVQLIFMLLIFVPVGIYIGNHFVDFNSEITAYYIGGGAFIFYLLVFLLISMIGDYAKFYLELNNSFNVFKAFGNGVKYVFQHFGKTYFLYLFLLFLPGVIMYVYLYFAKDLKMAVGLGIFIAFLIQQVFIIFRIFLRNWILSSQLYVYDEDFMQMAEVEQVVQSIVDKKIKDIEQQKEIFSESLLVESKHETNQEEIDFEEELPDSASKYKIDFDNTFSNKNDDIDKLSETEKQENIETDKDHIDELSEAEIQKRMETERDGFDEQDEDFDENPDHTKDKNSDDLFEMDKG